MKVKRIELEGPAGHVAIERQGDQIRIDSILHSPKGEQAWVTKTISARATDHAEEEELFRIAELIQRRCDGYRGTNSDIHGYFTELQRFTD